MTTQSLTPGAILLLLVDAIREKPDGLGASTGIPRHDWLMKVLVEQLLAAASPNGELTTVAVLLADSDRGVTKSSIAPVLHELIMTERLVPTGVGREARWRVSREHAIEISKLRERISDEDLKTIEIAAQRAQEISVAWSKTFCA